MNKWGLQYEQTQLHMCMPKTPLDCPRQLDILVNGYFFSFLPDVFPEKLQTKTSTLFLRVSVK